MDIDTFLTRAAAGGGGGGEINEFGPGINFEEIAKEVDDSLFDIKRRANYLKILKL